MATITGGPWTTGEVVGLSGVTSRTLRHSDDIGLLVPIGTNHGGHRIYGETELLRLQEILILRELGLPLSEITVALSSSSDRLAGERNRLETLANTIAATIETRDGNTQMAANQLYEGFGKSEHEQEARERWGEAAVAASNVRWQALTDADRRAHLAEADDISRAFAALLGDGVPADDARTREAVARHRRWVVSWTPTDTEYVELAKMYTDDPRFAANYDAVAPGLAGYIRAAITAHTS